MFKSQLTKQIWTALFTLTFSYSAVACCGFRPPVKPIPKTTDGDPAVSKPKSAPSSSLKSMAVSSSIKARIRSAALESRTSAQMSAASKVRPAATEDDGAVLWQYSTVDAQRLAFEIDQCFALYFCSPGAGALAGEGPKAWSKARQENPDNLPSPTIFENPQVLKMFEKHNLNTFVKIPRKAENEDVFKTYNAPLNTLIICAPNGDRLAQFSGQDCNHKLLDQFFQTQFEDTYGQWQRRRSLEAFDKKKAKIQGIQSIDDNRLWNAWRFTDKLVCGARLWDDDCYRALAEMGIKTLIQVGACPPEKDKAAEFGMRYVHLPLAYGGIPDDTSHALAKAIRELPGPIYIHCNCGIHRSPAAAAVACVELGLMDPEQGVRALEKIGCDAKFKGLYDSVRNAKRADPKFLDDLPVKFGAVAELPPMTQTMVEWGATWELIETAQDTQWNVQAKHTDVNPPRDIQKLIDQLQALPKTEHGKAQNDGWHKLMAEGEAAAREMKEAFKAWKHDTVYSPEQVAAFNLATKKVYNNCNTCHDKFRDNVFPISAAAAAEEVIGPRRK